jgi:transposase
VCNNGPEFLASKQITVLEHPPYSPDLAPIREDKENIERKEF